MNLSTTARVKALISSQGTAPTNVGTELDAVLATVSAAVEVYLDRGAEEIARTEYFDVEPGQVVFRLRAYPVVSVASVYFDDEQSFGASTAIASTEYYNPVLDNTGVLEMRWPLATAGYICRRALKVTYTGGLGATASAVVTAFPAIAGAVDQQTAHEWHRRNAMGTTAVTYPDGTSASIGFDRWLPSVKQCLDYYRRVSVPR